MEEKENPELSETSGHWLSMMISLGAPKELLAFQHSTDYGGPLNFRSDSTHSKFRGSLSSSSGHFSGPRTHS